MPRSPSPERSYPARRRGGGGGHHVLPSRCRSPSPPPRRSLRPRRAAAASSRPLVDDFFPFPSSPSSSPPRPQQRRAPEPEPSSSDSDGGGVAGSSASDRRRRKLKLVVKLSQLPPDQQQRRAPPPPPYSDSSEGEERPAGDGSGAEEQVKPPKKRRIESRDDRSRNQEVAGRSDAASAPRTKRLPVPGMARTTPLPDRQTLDMILDKLQKKDTYGVFAAPVDLDELPDYNDVIEHPMDFGTVKRKLARNAYRSFEQFEDDIFLICSNAMLYNAPDTVYFRQAHSIQELARKKFQEMRDEGIPTENQVKSERKIKPIPCNRGPIKKPVLRYSEDDLDFLTRKEPIKRPDAKISGVEISFKDQVKKPVSRNSENLSSFHKERVKKPIFRNSDNNLSSSFHGEVKKPISRNSEDDQSSSFQQVKVRKAVSRNSEDDRNSSFRHVQVKRGISGSPENDQSSSFPLRKVKKPTSRSAKDDLPSQKTHVNKPVCRNGEDPDCSSHTDPFENPVCKKVEDVSLSPEKLVEEPSCRYGDDLDHSRQKESSRQPICRDGQDELGYSCNEEIVKKSDCVNSQDAALGSNVSPGTIVSAGNGSDGLSVSHANGAEPPECTLANGSSDKDISSPVDEVRSEKTDDVSAKDYSAKLSLKSFVVDETRRKTYNAPEDEPSSNSDPTFDVFCAEPKELISVGLHSEHSYARSLARFAGSLGARGWRIASERIQKTLPAEVRFGRGWVGEYEPPLPPILAVQDQLRSQVSSDIQRKASLPRDNERLRPKESINPKDMSLSLLNRITTVSNVTGVTGSLESPEFKPRLFDVAAEPQQRNTDALPLHEKHRVPRNAVKTKRATSEQVRKGRPSSNACPPEVQPQRSECSKGASSSVLDTPAVNKMAGQPVSFFQPPEAVRTQLMKKSDPSKIARPLEIAPQRLDCPKGAVSGVHDMLSQNNSNGHSKPFFQSQERAPEVQPQRSECSKGASSSVLDTPAVNKMAGQPVSFFQPPEAVRTQLMKKSDPSKIARPLEIAPQRLDCPKGAVSGVHDMLSQNNSNGHSKPFFQSQERAPPQPKNEATWVYHGRPGDVKFATSEKSRPMSNIGFITKNPVNANGFAMNASAQNNVIDHAKSMGVNAIPGQVNLANQGFDAPRSIFSSFPTAARENQTIPSASVAQSWISFGASSENKPTIVSPNFHDNSSGWKMPFGNVRTSDEPKISPVPQFFRQPVQVSRENPGQNKGLVIFPQLVQTDFSRSQGQPHWQGLVPHMQQKPNKDLLRPDLNIGFSSPGSPPARQSSGINLEAQQPDLALQL